MEFTWSWEYILAIVIVLAATIALITGNLSQERWYTAIALVISFLSGLGIGYLRAKHQ